MRVLGIDPSLTSTGVASVNGYTLTHDRIDPKSRRGTVRLHFIRENVLSWVTARTDLVVMEGPSYGSKGSGQHERGGLWWYLLLSLESTGVPVAIVPPTSRAKYATGVGNAGKDAVLVNVVRRYAVGSEVANDEADAVILAAMGARFLGHPLETSLPKANLAAMDLPTSTPASLTGWPDLVADVPAPRSRESMTA